ncbi:4373_t:CDS:1, partial [Entrophospora sp. SA101]
KAYLSIKAGGEETCFQLLKLDADFDPNKQLSTMPIYNNFESNLFC